MTRTTLAARGKVLEIGVVSSYQRAAAGVMAVGAVCKMRLWAGKRISMTRGAVIRTRSRYKTAVIWRCYMQRAPGIRMTGLAGAAGREGLTGCIRYQGTVCIMTRGTGVMRIGCCTGQRRRCMTVQTAGGADYGY